MSSAANPSIAVALRALRERLTTAARAAQLPRPPVLVAVSKTKPASAVQEAYDSEQRHFGENYVVELLEKAPQLPGDVRWHFIGHLQSNKAKALAALPNLHLVESVDNEKLATALNKACTSALPSVLHTALSLPPIAHAPPPFSRPPCSPSSSSPFCGPVRCRARRASACADPGQYVQRGE